MANVGVVGAKVFNQVPPPSAEYSHAVIPPVLPDNVMKEGVIVPSQIV